MYEADILLVVVSKDTLKFVRRTLLTPHATYEIASRLFAYPAVLPPVEYAPKSGTLAMVLPVVNVVAVATATFRFSEPYPLIRILRKKGLLPSGR